MVVPCERSRTDGAHAHGDDAHARAPAHHAWHADVLEPELRTERAHASCYDEQQTCMCVSGRFSGSAAYSGIVRWLVACVGLFGCAPADKQAVVVSPVSLPEPAAQVEPAPAPAPAPPPVPHGYVRAKVAGIVPEHAGAAIALADPTQALILPVYVGGSEATSIQHRFEHTTYARPLTHDLMDALMHEAGAEVVRSQIDKLENNTFYGTLVVKLKQRFVELDARPSDAIALAMGSGAPIWVRSDVFEQAGVPRDSFEGLNQP